MKSPNRCRFVPINRHRCVDFPSKVSFKIPCEITLFQGCDVCNECSCLIVMRHLLNKIEMGIFDFPFDSKRVIIKKPHVNAYRHSGWLSFSSTFDIFLILSKIEGSSSSLSQFRIDSIPASYISTVVIVLGNVTKCILSYVYA